MINISIAHYLKLRCEFFISFVFVLHILTSFLGQRWKLAQLQTAPIDDAEAHQFEPIAVETMGVYGESTVVILRAIGRRLVEATGERSSMSTDS